MRKTFILIAIIFTLLLSGAGFNLLYSQSPIGKWVDSGFNITLVLNADFTYSLKYQNGKSSGNWSSQGNRFCLKDSSSNIPICYTVVIYSAGKMVLRDVNGVVINYSKVSSASTTPKNTRKVFKGKSDLKILANKNGIALTYRHFKHGLDLTQFIIGNGIKKSEIDELKYKLIEEFNTNPSLVVKQLDSIGVSMKKVHNAKDPVKVGKVRQEIFTSFYKLTRNMREERKPLMIRIINRYIKVLSYDQVNNLLLTNRDVDGYINYLAFNSELAGNKITVNYAVRRSVRDQLVKNFYSMPLQQKQLLSSASLMWQLVDANWKRLSYAQRVQYINAYRAKISNNFKYNRQSTNYNNYSRWTPPKNYGSQKKSLSQMRREFNAKQNMFRMMNNMNLNTHALSLNIIENMGGTGNYWKVTDY